MEDYKLENIKTVQSGGRGMTLEFEEAIEVKVFEEAGFTVSEQRGFSYLIESDDPNLRAELLRITSEHSLPLVSLKKADKSLEEIFQGLTKGGGDV